MSRNLAVLAESLGVPAYIPITPDIQHANCDAEEAELVCVEGENAVYRGRCANGHRYEIRVKIKQQQKEAKRKKQISVVNGELAVGDDEGFEATELEEY
jgi:hypothetical protein